MVDELTAAEGAQGRQGDVLIDAQGRDEPEPFAVLGHHTDAGRERILRRPDHQRPTFEGDDTARGGLESVDGADHFGASGAHQAGKGDHFAAVLDGLRMLEIPFTIEPKLVRGLDYYRRTIFEFQGGTLDSAQNALGGGGRYDGLVEALGGPATPGIGFALGVDRTLLACDDEGVFADDTPALDAFVVDVVGGQEALAITAELRHAGLTADRGFDNRSMKAQMKLANRSDATYALIVGDDEAANGTVVVKPMRGGDQVTISRHDLISHLKDELSTPS